MNEHKYCKVCHDETWLNTHLEPGFIEIWLCNWCYRRFKDHPYFKELVLKGWEMRPYKAQMKLEISSAHFGHQEVNEEELV